MTYSPASIYSAQSAAYGRLSLTVSGGGVAVSGGRAGAPCRARLDYHRFIRTLYVLVRTVKVENPTQKAVVAWLLRTVPNHEVRHVARVASVIGTARGRVRPENQDKAVAAVFEASIPRLDFYAFGACDGLGGMQDGGRCAASALSHFLTHLVSTFAVTDRALRLRQALLYANDSVATEFHERGGTTLSAVLVTHSGVTAISVGDTRIYRHAQKGELRQLTVDDTIAGRVEALANESGASEPTKEWSPFGHHLAQFVGQRAPLQPQVLGFDVLSGSTFADSRNGLLITTDGVHRIGRETFTALVRGATSAKEVVQHLITVADWTGGVDNATAMWISLQQPSRPIHDAVSSGRSLHLFDAHGDYFVNDARLEAGLTHLVPQERLPLLPERKPSLLPERKSEGKPVRRKRPVKSTPLKGGKKKRKGQGRRGRSQRSDDDETQPELDIKVTQHTE